MDVCKCIVPLRHGGTLNSHRAGSPLVRLVEGKERRESPDHPMVIFLKIRTWVRIPEKTWMLVNVRHGSTLNSRRAASPLVRLVEEEEKWEASAHP
ncbi:hypothetical protein TNCV_4968831 [Trichonephila clavipes]|nr:hypothetical protein TNCV_4968831 [Trichonephila clavipes]